MIKLWHCFLFIPLHCITISGCHPRNEQTMPMTGSIVSSVYAAGTVKARNQYEVYSKINGIIKTKFAEENDLLSCGSPLFEIGNESIQLNTNKAALSAAFNSIYSNEVKIQELKNNIVLAQSKYSIDSLNFKRQQYLFEHNIGSRNELEQRELELISSKAALTSAWHTYEIVVRQLRFTEKISDNDLLISKSNQADYTIRSRINGKVYAIFRQEGEMVNPTTPIAMIGDADDFYVELEVDELDVSKIQLKQKVIMSLDSYADRTFEGWVSKIYPMMDERTKTFTIEVDFASRPKVLYPMLTVEASILIEEKNNALIIPRSYLLGDSFVISVTGKRRVTTGIKDYEKVEITSGLSANDIIQKPAK